MTLLIDRLNDIFSSSGLKPWRAYRAGQDSFPGVFRANQPILVLGCPFKIKAVEEALRVLGGSIRYRVFARKRKFLRVAKFVLTVESLHLHDLDMAADQIQQKLQQLLAVKSSHRLAKAKRYVMDATHQVVYPEFAPEKDYRPFAGKTKPLFYETSGAMAYRLRLASRPLSHLKRGYQKAISVHQGRAKLFECGFHLPQ